MELLTMNAFEAGFQQLNSDNLITDLYNTYNLYGVMNRDVNKVLKKHIDNVILNVTLDALNYQKIVNYLKPEVTLHVEKQLKNFPNTNPIIWILDYEKLIDGAYYIKTGSFENSLETFMQLNKIEQRVIVKYITNNNTIVRLLKANTDKKLIENHPFLYLYENQLLYIHITNTTLYNPLLLDIDIPFKTEIPNKEIVELSVTNYYSKEKKYTLTLPFKLSPPHRVLEEMTNHLLTRLKNDISKNIYDENESSINEKPKENKKELIISKLQGEQTSSITRLGQQPLYGYNRNSLLNLALQSVTNNGINILQNEDFVLKPPQPNSGLILTPYKEKSIKTITSILDQYT